MKKTEHTIDNKTVSYEIVENGYVIYLDDVKWVTQFEPYIPYPELGYEGSCLKQIDELVAGATTSDMEEPNEINLTEAEEAIFNTNVNVEYLVALQELNI